MWGLLPRIRFLDRLNPIFIFSVPWNCQVLCSISCHLLLNFLGFWPHAKNSKYLEWKRNAKFGIHLNVLLLGSVPTERSWLPYYLSSAYMDFFSSLSTCPWREYWSTTIYSIVTETGVQIMTLNLETSKHSLMGGGRENKKCVLYIHTQNS